MLHLDRVRAAPLVTEPFPYLVATGVLAADGLEAVNRDFPAIRQPGIFPLDTISGGPRFEELVADIEGPALRAALAEKFGLDLTSLPLMVTVRGWCQAKDGRIHTDSKDKVLTCLLYLNQPDWPAEGGRLRLLRNGDRLEDTIAEVPPLGGTLVAFKRTDRSWHGHAPFEGQRRYIMFNWVTGGEALHRNLFRHRVSAAVKRVFA